MRSRTHRPTFAVALPAALLAITLVATAAWALALRETVLPDAQVGVEYAASVTATGGSGTLSWKIAEGTLPAGLRLVPGQAGPSARIQGVPSRKESASFTVQVTDGSGHLAASSYTITVK